MRETFNALVQRLQGIRPSWPQVPEAARQQEQVWYTGLAVSPVDFSRQLATLQLSLQGKPVTPVAAPVDPASSVPVPVQASGQNVKANLSGHTALQ